MENPEEDNYEVIITDPAEMSFSEILDYLYHNYPLAKAEKIVNEIRDTARTLRYQPESGSREPRQLHRGEGHRFIFYKLTKRAYNKIIYYIPESENKVSLPIQWIF